MGQSGMNEDGGAQLLDRDTASRLSKGQSNGSLATMTQYSVDVFDQRHVLHVYQYADNLWIAVGEFLGHPLRTIGRTARKAVRAWQKAAIEKRLLGED